MNLVGQAALAVPSSWLRKVTLHVLFARTAAALGQPAPTLHHLSICQTLDAYAQFTSRAAAAIAEPDRMLIGQHLFRTGWSAGLWLRRLFGIRSMADAMTVARWCYRLLAIDFEGTARGEVCVARCSFSTVYSPQVCAVMSELDAGLLAGLTDGGRLVFSQRLTEGFDCCRARVST